MNRSQDIVEAVDEVAEAIRSGCRHLGTADAATPMGALEAHGTMMIEAAEKIASSISDLAEAVRESGPRGSDYNEVAGAISGLAAAVREDRGE